jgi:spore maturation protein CgeB
MVSSYQNSWLAIDEPLAYDGRTRQIKARLFENASMGCLVLTKHNDRVERYFEPGREILFWETIPELIDIIRDFIANPATYKEMAYLAYQRAQREHLYKHRFTEIFNYITERANFAI